MMVLTLCRNDASEWDLSRIVTLPNATHIKLAPLDVNECLQAIANFLSISEFPDDIIDLIPLANGNPLFAQELTLGLIKSGFLSVKNGVVHLNEELNSMKVRSEIINGVICSRIDVLDPSLQMVVKVASVFGLRFEKDILQSIYPIEKEKLRIPAYIKLLCQRGIFKKISKGVYVFANRITQIIAYHRVLFQHRKELHEAIVNRYSAKWTHPNEEQSYQLAYHWMQTIENSKYYKREDLKKCIRSLQMYSKTHRSRSRLDLLLKDNPNAEDVEPSEEFELWVSKMDAIVRSLRDEDEEEEAIVRKRDLMAALKSMSRSRRGDASFNVAHSTSSSLGRRSVEFVP